MRKLLAYYFVSKERREKTARVLRKRGYKVRVRGEYIITDASGVEVHRARTE